MDPRYLEVGLILLGVAFNAGGFVWLTRNHLRHLREAIATVQTTLEEIGERVSFIEGHLGIQSRSRRR